MRLHRLRTLIFAGALIAALTCTALGTGFAFAKSGGDNVSDAWPILSLPFSTPGSLDSTSAVRDVFSVHLQSGQTLDASMTADLGTDFDLFLYGPKVTSIDETTTPRMTWSAGPTSVEHFTFMAADSGTYYLDVHAFSGSGLYTLDAKIIPAVKFKTGWLTLQKSAKKGKNVKTTVTVTPAYNGTYSPINFYFYRYENHKYKKKATKWGGGTKNPGGTKTVFYTNYKFPKKGKWRVRAGFWDEAHRHEVFTSYKYITIK
jgi:Bacterial pre-peptidase C-terminal domain